MKRRIWVRLSKIRMRTSRIGAHNQAVHGLALAEKIHNLTYSNPLASSRPNIFNEIPPNMCDHVTNTWFDPYNRVMDQKEIQAWLWDHVIFDPAGHIVAIHDRGEILVYADGWRDEVEWFGLVKMSEWEKSRG